MSKRLKAELTTSKQEQIIQQRVDRAKLKQMMFSSSLITYMLAGVFLVFSILMNAKVLEIPNPDATTPLKVVDVLLRGGLIILFFFFMFVSMGNLKELRGYIMTWKEMLFLIIISLFQTITEGWALLTATLGIIIILVYFYFIQGKIQE